MRKILIFAAFVFSLFNFSACSESDFDFQGLEVKILEGKDSQEYISLKIKASEFNAWFVKFNIEGEGEASLKVAFGGSKEWSEVELECEEKLCSGFMTSELLKSYQFNLTLKGAPGFRASDFVVETKDLSSQKKSELIPAAAAKLSDLGIISRENWGASPDYLLYRELPASSGTVSPAWAARKKKCAELVEKYPEEFEKQDKVFEFDSQNRELHWPYEYSKKVSKIVIHSTATDGEKDLNGDDQVTFEDAQATVRAIYYYHSMFRGWGDIGYHYLIDPFGNIYEGKSGGDYVIGAHAYCANTGTIGVSFIGDHEAKLPTNAALSAAESLLGELSNLYGLNLNAESVWHGKETRGLVGHRDYGATRCPGDALHAYLPDLAKRANNYAVENKLSSLDFDYKILENDSPLVMNPLSEGFIRIKLKNIGKKTWPKNSEFSVSRKIKDVILGSARLEKSVRTGDSVTLDIPVSTKLQSGRYRFAIVPDFSEEAPKIYITVKVNKPQLDYEFVSAVHPPQPFKSYSIAEAEVRVRNNSNFTWNSSGDYAVYLGTVRPEGGQSPFLEDSSKLGILEKDAAPGQIAKFKMRLKAPAEAGNYLINFAPAIKDFGYFPDRGMKFKTSVREPRFSAVMVDMSARKDLRFQPGETKEVFFELRNTSELVWNPEQFKLKILRTDGLKVLAEYLSLAEEVQEKEKVRFTFPLTALAKQGRYKLEIQPTWQNQPSSATGGLRSAGGKLKKGSVISFWIEVLPPSLTGELVEEVSVENLNYLQSRMVEVAYKNTGNVTWNRDSIILQRLPAQPSSFADESWLSPLHPAKLREEVVQPGEIGHFDFLIRKNQKADIQAERFALYVRGLGRVRGKAIEIQLRTKNAELITQPEELGDQNLNSKVEDLVELASGDQEQEPDLKVEEPTIRIKLSFDSDRVEVGGGEFVLENQSGTKVFEGSFVDFESSKLSDGEYYRVVPKGNTILEIPNWKHYPAWTDEINDNKFRGILEIRKLNDPSTLRQAQGSGQGKLVVINELPLEDYLRGIAEPLSTDPEEKVLLLAVLARSYAMYYTDPEHRKFPGQPYDGSDDPAEFQKYLGYNYELRGNMPEAVEETKGLVITHNGKVVKTPYFTSSGGRTKTAAEARWNVDDFLFTKSVSDPWSCGLTSKVIDSTFSCPENAKGHGVGVSGMGAAGLAREGKTFREILDYFFDDVEIEKLY